MITKPLLISPNETEVRYLAFRHHRVKEGAISQVLVCLGYSNVRISKNIVDIKEG